MTGADRPARLRLIVEPEPRGLRAGGLAYDRIDGGPGTIAIVESRAGSGRHARVSASVEVEGRVTFDRGKESPGSTVFVVLLAAPDCRLDDLDSWFIEEHAPLLLTDPEWLRSRLVELAGAAPFTRMAVHSLASPEALTSENRLRAGQTARTQEVLAGSWTTDTMRFVGRRTQG